MNELKSLTSRLKNGFVVNLKTMDPYNGKEKGGTPFTITNRIVPRNATLDY